MTDEEKQLLDEIFREVDVCVDQCWAEHASDVPNLLFHYTSTEGLVGIVTTRKFFLSDMLASTDQTEIRYGIEIVHEVIAQLLGKSGSVFLESLLKMNLNWLGIGKSWFMNAICFCAGDDVLTQWRGYSPAGGCAIGVDFKEMKQKAQKGFDLTRMLYASDKQREIIRRIIECGQRLLPRVLKASEREHEGTDFLSVFRNRLAVRLVRSFLRFKHPAFSSEDEWRFFTTPSTTTPEASKIRFRARGNAIIPYRELSFDSEPTLIRQIRCSPGVWSRSALYGVNQLAKSLGDHLKVTQSELPL
jgi:hypothetical protein